ELHITEFRQRLEVLRIGLELVLQRLNPRHIEGWWRRFRPGRLLTDRSSGQWHCANHFRGPLLCPGVEGGKADRTPDQQKRPCLLLHATMIAGNTNAVDGSGLTTPSAPSKVASQLFLDAQPPLLSEEGTTVRIRKRYSPPETGGVAAPSNR